jgi:hypothetical protein
MAFLNELNRRGVVRAAAPNMAIACCSTRILPFLLIAFPVRPLPSEPRFPAFPKRMRFPDA